ncbi:alkaline serine protease, putative [Anopheles sinensis]|uniref:Alkaline serine protease, putative n=1 Tax=Anopheles sinensis TaxID=74873 RepID=A0A084VZJ0_ANOSI|nr:alkaline serine protease, putative [Anopheles sinensis]
MIAPYVHHDRFTTTRSMTFAQAVKWTHARNGHIYTGRQSYLGTRSDGLAHSPLWIANVT